MLIYQDNADIFTVFCKSVESCFDSRRFGFAVHNEEVLFGVGTGRDVLHILLIINPTFDNHITIYTPQCQPAEGR